MQWDQDDLQTLISDKMEEPLHIEYKRELNTDKPKDRKEIAKDVSAFANALRQGLHRLQPDYSMHKL